LFRKMHRLTGFTADLFDVVLMVDADTVIQPDSISKLVWAVENDHSIMGLTGETRIANKHDSWVTMVQVFDYHISHHLGKSFESIFGGVTCLPGCFSMYRIKVPAKQVPKAFTPILAHPDVVATYAQNTVTSLHEKNLLLLGEDRFLTTLMLKTFPHRKFVFVPDAICKTIVPNSFKVLLSQRRRWINSTIHNLMELVLVRELCGTFCISMQVVILIDLVGTVVLPAALILTIALVVFFVMTLVTAQGPLRLVEWLPMISLLIVFFSPALLICLTSRKVVYVGWMFLYLLSLPLWNFVLPLYSYWHFDDFSWGETRKVDGDKGHGHTIEMQVPHVQIETRKWEEWEMAWRRDVLLDCRRMQSLSDASYEHTFSEENGVNRSTSLTWDEDVVEALKSNSRSKHCRT
jgi:chitin synthase